jgi:hypothetical protein
MVYFEKSTPGRVGHDGALYEIGCQVGLRVIPHDAASPVSV